jgi:hypothetical protein
MRGAIVGKRLFRRFGFAVTVAAVSAGVYVTLGSAAGTASPPTNESPPTISGAPLVGKTLTAANGSWSGTNPMSFAHEWQRCNSSGGSCAAIGSATSLTYTAQSADAGHTLRVAVTATNADGTGGPVLSSPTAVVTATSAPVNTTAPQLTGTLKEGSTLHVTSGTWTGTTPISYAYEWQRCNGQGANCSPFKSGSGTSHTLGAADVGNRIQVRVTASNSAGSASKYSNQTGVIGGNAVAPANTAAPQLTGTLVEGQVLNVTGGTWTGTDPISLAYQWQRCNGQGVNCAPIAGVGGSSYTLTAADIGARLQVYVTATNAGGSASKYSNQVGPVARSTAAVPATSVNLPNRLVVDRIQYPGGGHSRTPFSARFHVADITGHSVSGALVYVVGLPYAWLRRAPEQPTDASGWASFTLTPTAKMPRSGALVMFVRARTPQGDVLAGASTRRLVQVRVRP